MLASLCRADVPQFDELKLGESYSGVVAIGDHAANKQIVLPAGAWRLILKGEGKTGPVQGGRQDGRQFKLQDLVLVQAAGPTLKALLYVHGSAEVASVNWLDEPCKRTNTLYRNAFDSSPWIQSCLLVNHLVGPLTLSASARQALKNIGVALPPAALSSQLTRYQRGGFLQLRVLTNPVAWGIASQPQTWSASAWHKDRIADDPARLAFSRQWQQWSEAYAGLLDQEFKGEVVKVDGKADEFPAFNYTPL
jgi:hypothetical protein